MHPELACHGGIWTLGAREVRSLPGVGAPVNKWCIKVIVQRIDPGVRGTARKEIQERKTYKGKGFREDESPPRIGVKSALSP